MKTIGVVGAGFYGAYIALKLADKGHRVIVFDPEDNTQSATLHCQARLHSGMFYVRSLTDLRSCARNFTKFFKLFKPYIYTGFNSYYLIDNNSKVSFDAYKQICKDNNLSVKEVSLDYVNKRSIQGILKANEFSIDTKGLLLNLRDKCKNHPNIEWVQDRVTSVNQEVMIITSDRVFRVDTCILASYGNNFKFLKTLGYSVDHLTYPLPVLKFKDNLPKDCHAVVDGDFWSSIVKQDYKLLTSKVNINDSNYEDKCIDLMQKYIPELEVKILGISLAKKVVMKGTREARITKYGNIYAVFSGKLTNIFDIINQIENLE